MIVTSELYAIAPTAGSMRKPNDRSVPHGGAVAVVPIIGELDKDHLAMLRDRVNLLAASPTVGAVLLLIDSPGGTVAGTADLAQAIARLAAAKKTVAFCEDLCCSGAYWLASQASEIVANSTASLGSIGVYRIIISAARALDAAGIDFYIVRSSGAIHKGAGVEGAQLTAEQLAEIQHRVDAVARIFIADVARGRKISVDRVSAIADGRVLIGTEAVAAGLVDRIAVFDDVLAELQARTADHAYRSLVGGEANAKFRELVAERKKWHPQLSQESLESLVAQEHPELANTVRAARIRKAKAALENHSPLLQGRDHVKFLAAKEYLKSIGEY